MRNLPWHKHLWLRLPSGAKVCSVCGIQVKRKFITPEEMKARIIVESKDKEQKDYT